jgi:hypothetical protein
MASGQYKPGQGGEPAQQYQAWANQQPRKKPSATFEQVYDQFGVASPQPKKKEIFTTTK